MCQLSAGFPGYSSDNYAGKNYRGDWLRLWESPMTPQPIMYELFFIFWASVCMSAPLSCLVSDDVQSVCGTLLNNCISSPNFTFVRTSDFPVNPPAHFSRCHYFQPLPLVQTIRFFSVSRRVAVRDVRFSPLHHQPEYTDLNFQHLTLYWNEWVGEHVRQLELLPVHIMRDIYLVAYFHNPDNVDERRTRLTTTFVRKMNTFHQLRIFTPDKNTLGSFTGVRRVVTIYIKSTVLACEFPILNLNFIFIRALFGQIHFNLHMFVSKDFDQDRCLAISQSLTLEVHQALGTQDATPATINSIWASIRYRHLKGSDPVDQPFGDMTCSVCYQKLVPREIGDDFCVFGVQIGHHILQISNLSTFLSSVFREAILDCSFLLLSDQGRLNSRIFDVLYAMRETGDITMFPCGHTTCTDCADNWLSSKKTISCPECCDRSTPGEWRSLGKSVDSEGSDVLVPGPFHK